jgi:hypothetical protein
MGVTDDPLVRQDLMSVYVHKRVEAMLNQRAADYAEFSFADEEPGYAFRRYFGEHVRAVMGEKDNQWITDQVMDIEVPEAMKPLRKAVRDLFPAAG